MLKFFYAPNTCALASHIALEEAGADYEAVRVDFKANAQRAPEYLAINPKGRVPALVTSDGILTETPAILAFIAQTYPKARLAPVDQPFAFARVQAFNRLLFGGVWMAVAWGVASVIMVITIIGLPWTRAAFNIGVYTLLPFGFKAVDRDEHFGRGDIGTGPLGVIGNVVWLVLAGWWLALGHVLLAIILAITIIGIPFAWAHLKLAGIALWPIGKIIVPAEDAPLKYPRPR